MSALDPFRNLSDWFANLNAMHRQFAQFTCGDCERWQRCGQPPSESCPVRRLELARGDWQRRRHPVAPAEW